MLGGVGSWRRRGSGLGPAADELNQSRLDDASLQEDVTSAGGAAQPDVRAEPVHGPGVPSARVAPPQLQHVAEAQLQDRACHQSFGEPWDGESDCFVAGTVSEPAGSTTKSVPG